MRLVGRSGVLLLRAATGVLRLSMTRPRGDAASTSAAAPEAAALIYELLDAHYDTAELAQELEYDEAWQAHLDYLRALQRKGRETLARMPSDAPAPARPRRALGERR
jgi:hypothetical protein